MSRLLNHLACLGKDTDAALELIREANVMKKGASLSRLKELHVDMQR